MKLWLDDERPAPEGWFWVETPEEALTLILKNEDEIEELSIDHDLAHFINGIEITGYSLLVSIEQLLFACGPDELGIGIPQKITIHSANAGARKKMELAIKKIEELKK